MQQVKKGSPKLNKLNKLNELNRLHKLKWSDKLNKLTYYIMLNDI